MRTKNVPGLVLLARPPLREDWRDQLRDHLLRLGPESRFNRFLGWTSDDAILRYVDTIGPELVIEARIAGHRCGLAELHLRKSHRPMAEIALSVEDDWQRLGIGAALFDKALRESRIRGVWEIWIFHLKSNLAIRRITERAGFTRMTDDDPSVVRARIGRPLCTDAEADRYGAELGPLR